MVFFGTYKQQRLVWQRKINFTVAESAASGNIPAFRNHCFFIEFIGFFSGECIANGIMKPRLCAAKQTIAFERIYGADIRFDKAPF